MKIPYLKKIFSIFKTDYRIITGYIIAFILLLVSYLITFYYNRSLIRQTESVTHTNTIISNLSNLQSAVTDGETGLRGFINSNDTSFLAPFYNSILSSNIYFKLLQRETVYNKQRQLQLEALKKLIDYKYDNIKTSINYFTSNNYKVDSIILQKTYSGKYTMDSIRNMIASIKLGERNLLENKSAQVQNKYAALNIIVVTSLLLAFIFAGFGVFTFIKETKERQKADEKVTEYQQQLKQRIQELDKANRELIEVRREEKFASTGRIARMIAHEVRNPLTNIDLALTQIKDEIKHESGEAEFLYDIIQRNSHRINQLITELLNATRVDDLNLEKISFNHLLDESLEMAKDRIDLDGTRIVKNYTSFNCDIAVDKEKLKFAFLNIIINGIEAMKANTIGVLTLDTTVENNKVIARISDNGIGMDKTALSKLFEAYYTTKPKGNGLGLTNAQNLILNHKGSIDVESEPGKGTTFIIGFDKAM